MAGRFSCLLFVPILHLCLPLFSPAPLQTLPTGCSCSKGPPLRPSPSPSYVQSSPAPTRLSGSSGAFPGSPEQEKLFSLRQEPKQTQKNSGISKCREKGEQFSCSCVAALCGLELWALKPVAGTLKNKTCPCHSGFVKWLIWTLLNLPYWRCPQTPRISPTPWRY